MTDYDSEDIEQNATNAAAEGIESVTADGMSVRQMDPMKQLDVASRVKRNAVSDPFKTLRTVRIVSPGGGNSE